MQEGRLSDLSNRDFLRASNIRVEIDYNIEGNFERIVELIRSAGALNYTDTRLSSPEEIEAFRNHLKEFAQHIGCVRVSDNYADYGLAGFFQMRQKARDRRLIHFVFSCRIMNMGVEQYVYRLLRCPELDAALPASPAGGEISDWIDSGSTGGDTGHGARAGKLVLLGGCDLLQVASYCSADRLEFVNRAEDDSKIRYDDFGFVLSSRDAVRDCPAIHAIACWSYDDAIRFDRGLADASVVILSLLQAMGGSYYDAAPGVWFRLTKRLAKPIRKRNPKWFDAAFQERELDLDARLKLTIEALGAIDSRVSAECQVFVLSGFTKDLSKKKLVRRRNLYNEDVRAFCAAHASRFHYVHVDALIPADQAIDAIHFTREAYFALARHILSEAAKTGSPGPAAGNRPNSVRAEFAQA